MDRFRIRGGRPLSGNITIGGAKNADLPLMAAGLLTEGRLVLTNVPLLADIHMMGLLLAQHGVAVDKPRAAECFRIAAERGLDWGMYNYATALTLGQGVPEDKPAALGWFERAASLGNAKAVNYIGSFHEDGWVVPRDLTIAADCYARAAQGGDFRGMFNHARMLADAGRIDAALAWLRRCGAAATRGGHACSTRLRPACLAR